MPSLGAGRAVLSLILCAASTTLPPPSFAQPSDPFETGITAELRAIAPAAESLFREANAARRQGDHARAARLYEAVLEKAPMFDHAVRRLGYEYVQLGDRRRGIATMERALAMRWTAENLQGLATVLLQHHPGSSPLEADVQRAALLLDSALVMKPDDLDQLGLRAQAAMVQNDVATLQSVAKRMQRVAPDSLQTLYFSVFAQWADGNFDGAQSSLERAHAAGLPDSIYASMRAVLEQQRPFAPRLLAIGAWIGGIWLAGALVLLALGVWLSRLTLHASQQAPVDPDVRVTGFDAWLRRTYRVVLWCGCGYYYMSMPILLAIVLLLGGGLIYGMLAVGHVPVKLLLIVGLITIFTLWAIVKSLLIRAVDEDPGHRLDLAAEPELKKVLEDVARRVGTHPVDAVFITPGTDVAVFERGGMLKQLRGHTERCLILGAGVLDGFLRRPFRAVLAHEYGHFSNRDTAGGGFALAVRRSTMQLAIGLAQSGAAGWYNPAWLFVNGFHLLFLRISQGASRLQEVLADRWSATLYGARAFEAGLRHVIERSIRFDAHVQATLREVVEGKRPLANLYAYVPVQSKEADRTVHEVQESIERPPSAYDSHPRPLDRFRWVHALGVEGASSPDDDDPVWTLFSNRRAIEELMTDHVRQAMTEHHGISITEAPTPA